MPMAGPAPVTGDEPGLWSILADADSDRAQTLYDAYREAEIRARKERGGKAADWLRLDWGICAGESVPMDLQVRVSQTAAPSGRI
jgi:hypothetical protein